MTRTTPTRTSTPRACSDGGTRPGWNAWRSRRRRRTLSRHSTRGTDTDARWWLCSSLSETSLWLGAFGRVIVLAIADTVHQVPTLMLVVVVSLSVHDFFCWLGFVGRISVLRTPDDSPSKHFSTYCF